MRCSSEYLLIKKKAKFVQLDAAISGPNAKFANRGTYSHEMHCIRSRNTVFTKYLCYVCLKKAYIHISQPWTPDPKFYILQLKPSLPLRRRLGIFLNFNHKYLIYCYFQELWWHSIFCFQFQTWNRFFFWYCKKVANVPKLTKFI